MALTTSYLVTTKNLEAFLKSIQTAQAPARFTLAFLESLDFKSTNDRLLIVILKALRFLTESGEPTDRYFRFLDQTQAPRVLAEGVREAYGDLFAVNIKANELTKAEVKNKLKTLTQGKTSENVLNWMSGTFEALCKLADFTAAPAGVESNPPVESPQPGPQTSEESIPSIMNPQRTPSFGSLQYVINIQLPESRDQAVYDALFKSLKEHLVR